MALSIDISIVSMKKRREKAEEKTRERGRFRAPFCANRTPGAGYSMALEDWPDLLQQERRTLKLCLLIKGSKVEIIELFATS